MINPFSFSFEGTETQNTQTTAAYLNFNKAYLVYLNVTQPSQINT